MRNEQQFKPCTPHPVKCGSKSVMVFETPFFEFGGSRFKLIGTEITPDDVIHDVMNFDTREVKQIAHDRLIQLLTLRTHDPRTNPIR